MYVLFRCLECSKLIAWPDNFADGHRCGCKGVLEPIDKGNEEELKEKYFILGDIEFKHKRRRV